MLEAVASSWEEIWATPLERTYTGDFEEYLSTEDIEFILLLNSLKKFRYKRVTYGRQTVSNRVNVRGKCKGGK